MMGNTDIYLSIQQAQDKLAELEATINKDNIILEEKDKFIKAKQKELETLNLTIEKYETDFEVIKSKIESDKGVLLDKIVPIREEVSLLTKTNEAIKSELIEGKKILEEFQIGMKIETDKLSAEYKAAESELDKALKAKGKELIKKQENSDKLDLNIAEAKDTIASLKEQLLKLSNEQSELQSIDKDIETKQKEVERLDIDLQLLNNGINKDKESLSQSKKTINTLDDEIMNLTKTKEGLALEIEESNKQKFILAQRENDLKLKEEFIKSKFEIAGVKFN